MEFRGVLQRHRTSIGSGVALAVAAAGIVVYAVSADGYRAHDARLNDGGIWVTNSSQGFHGRLNKPIAQLDGALFAKLEASLDVVQDGASVVAVNASDGLIAPIDPATQTHPEGDQASVPGIADIALAGGSLVVADPTDGRVWATRVADGTVPSVVGLDQQNDPLVTVGDDAAISVTRSGAVVAVSGSKDTVTTIAPDGGGWGKPDRADLPEKVGEGVAVTTVGETVVVLDSGQLSVIGGGRAEVPADGVLQQPGPDATSVLVATADSLIEVDLASGRQETVVDGVTTSTMPAHPVRLGDCVYAAWSGGQGTVATACGDGEATPQSLQGDASNLVFRVNRGEIVLNDRSSGAVWEIDSDDPTRLDNWEDFLKPDEITEEETENEKEDAGDRRPPQAKPDRFGARPGRVTVLHPLDNDTAPKGRILAIRSVETNDADAPVTISPDGQTLQITLPESGARGTSFEYYIDDGRDDVSAHATVTVTPRLTTANGKPHLRENFTDRSWTVPAGGVIDVPVLPDWRDNEDGDPLTVASTVAEGGDTSGARARVTSSGRVRFTAPAKGGPVTVKYAISDGVSAEPVTNDLTFQVQDPADRQAVAAVAEPDIVAGEAGKPITIRPLGNDLPGSDPVTPDAELALGGKVASTGGAKVDTDVAEGTITFTSDIARSYFLDYDAAFGGAAFAPGRIRVDVRPRQSPTPPPVAVPDTVTVHGQAAALVDVLANDVDPTGGMLVVQRAAARVANQLDVAVVDGRWLRVAARQGTLLPNPQVVRYTISNGERSGEGEIVVRQAEPPADNTPVTGVDRVTVRAGAGVAVPVLDNDFSPSGDALGLVGNVEGQEPGQLPVQRPGDEPVPTGQAFVAGRFVRYVAPADLREAQTFTVPYVATNESGETAPGRVEVEVIPLDRENRPPEPPLLEGRAVSGDTIKLKLPGSGVDPDGDSVTLLGLGSPSDGSSGAPQLGRVVRFGANSLHYQTYPGSQGTEEFTYQVTDAFGAVATGTARIAIVPPGPPQPPLAVNDSMTVEPGRVATVDVLANDLIATGDRVQVELIDAPDGVELESPTGPVNIEAPEKADGRNVEVVYSISNGLDTSRGTVTLRTRQPYNNPPVVFDAFGPNEEGDEVTVDVLAEAYDPDGPSADLEITDVFAPAGVRASADGGKISVERGPQPIVVPFRVEDVDGGAATASLYVPATGSGLPYVKADGVIRLDPGQTKKLDLGTYVVNPAGGPVSFTLKDRIWPSPFDGVSASITGEDAFSVSAAKGYAGPGAVTFEVTTGETVDDPDGLRAVLSVPVQVGDPKPILRCPTEAVDVSQGEVLELDIATLCHVWTAVPEDADSLDFEATWAEEADGLSIAEDGAPVVEVAASTDVTPGTQGLLEVTAEGSAPGQIRIRAVKAPPPSLTPIRVADMRAGETRVINLARYLVPGVDDPEPTVLEAVQLSGLDVQIAKEGASSVRLTTGARVDGRAQFKIVMGDAGAGSGPERRVEGRIALDILDVPDRPLAPVPGRTVRSQEVHLEWRAPAANGSPIDHYEVRANTGKVTRCGSTVCDVTGLTNGEWYTFSTRAHNAVGWSEWSPPSARARPDAKPGAVGPIQMTSRGDGTVSLAWTPPTTQTSAIEFYYVTWPGGSAKPTKPSLIVTGLDNNNPYEFKVQAKNALDYGPLQSATYQSIGTPATPGTVAVTPTNPAGDTTGVIVSWPEVSPPNGPGPVRYTVTRNGAPICEKTISTQCENTGINYDGTKYTYAVTAFNDDGNGPQSGASTTEWSAVGQPAAWGDWDVRPTGRNNEATAQFTVPGSRGAQSIVKILVNGTVRDQAQRTGAQSVNFQVPSNDGGYDVVLQVCNESGACSSSSTKRVQTYGPFDPGHIIRATADIREVGLNVYETRWTVTVDTNGDSASVRLTSRSGTAGEQRNERHELGGVDVQTFVSGPARIDAGTSDILKVTLFDDSPNRAAVSREFRYTTPERKNPEVTIRRGTLCSDDPASPRPACGGGGGGGELCLNASCGKIQITSSNYADPSARCEFYDSVDGQYLIRTVETNKTVEPGPYYGYPGRQVWVVCNGAVSNKYTWPS